MNNITTELVERIARARIDGHAAHFAGLPETDRSGVPDFALKTWEKQDKLTQHGVRETVLNQLNELTPHLIDAGWLPPAKHDAIRETVRDLSVNELHKSLMNSIMIDRENSGHTTQEGLNGYSEGVEHGTISLASRIKHILDGE